MQGADVWLNTPLRPLEACGTSGQKVVLNGGLNCSVLDGWWAEAYDGENGFGIGATRVHQDPAVQARSDTEALYDVLECMIIPLFYDRDTGVPTRWVARMKRAITTLAWRFNADRMVTDYARHCYVPAAGVDSSEFAWAPAEPARVLRRATAVPTFRHVPGHRTGNWLQISGSSTPSAWT